MLARKDEASEVSNSEASKARTLCEAKSKCGSADVSFVKDCSGSVTVLGEDE